MLADSPEPVLSHYGSLATPETILGLAHQAEAAGFESIWVADHIAFPVSFKSAYSYSAKGDFPSRLADPLMEPVATMGVLVGADEQKRQLDRFVNEIVPKV